MASSPSHALRATIDAELSKVSFVDPHSHIDPQAPAARSLNDILGYHYYTELVHSAGTPREAIERAGIAEDDRVAAVVAGLGSLTNTVQYSWLMEIARDLFGFTPPHLDATNWRELADRVRQQTAAPGWADSVLEKSRMEAVFLTNDFDDPLEGFDTAKYVPCLRVDELVFHLGKPGVLERLTQASGVEPVDVPALHRGVAALAEKFVRKGARAAAISLPPDFRPRRIEADAAARALADIRRQGLAASAESRAVLASDLFWTVAECCDQQRIPFDLMIGVRRGVYPGGVYQGQDLLDGRLSLAEYAPLFNAFPRVKFPVSVLSQPLNHELVSFAWIFPNVFPFGHWWYANTPSSIERDLEQRIEAVPRTKMLGYYSDMYKLEFGYPKFAMYRRILAGVLAKRFVEERGWSEEQAVALGLDLLVHNTRRVFYSAEASQ
jgi:glucuronate isomerase